MRAWTSLAAPTLVVVVVALALAVSPSVAHAQQRIEQAKKEFLDGRAAYERGDYRVAYDRFKQSYILSQQPALLYNIASALQGLGRPGEAAEVLRDYLKAVPNDPERPLVEKRIAGLEEAQRLIDREAALQRRREEEERRAREQGTKPQPDAAAMAERARREEELRLERERLAAERERLAVERAAVERAAATRPGPDPEVMFQIQLERQSREEKRKRRNLAIGLSIGGILLAGAAVGLAIGLTQKSAPPESPFDIGPIPGTQ